MNNQRKNRRIGCMVPIEGKEGGPFDHVRTLDISRGGLGFISDHQIPLNKQIAVQIDVSEHEEPILAIGKVQWVSPLPDSCCFRIGMSFEDVLRGSKTRLDQYFASQKKG